MVKEELEENKEPEYKAQEKEEDNKISTKATTKTEEADLSSQKVEDLGSIVRTASNYTDDKLDETATQRILDETKGIDPNDPDTTLVKSSNPQADQDLDAAKRIVDNVKLSVPPIEKNISKDYVPEEPKEYKPKASESPIKENIPEAKKEYNFSEKGYNTTKQTYDLTTSSLEESKEESEDELLPKKEKKEEKYS